MKAYFANNSQLIIIGLIWLVVGIYLGPTIQILMPVMVFLMYRKRMFLEILLGFFLVLTLSDSRLSQLSFAGSAKNVYMLMLFLIAYTEAKATENPINLYKNFVPFFIIAGLCIFFNPTMNLSFQKTLSYVLLIMAVPNFFLIVYKLYGDELFKNIVFLCCLMLGLGLILNVINPSITNLVGRYRGVLGNPNGLGLYTFLFILFFTVVNEHNPNLFTKKEKIFIYLLAFFSLLKCGARSSLISTLLFFLFKKFYKISPWLGFLLFIIVFIAYQLISENLTEIILSLGLGKELRVETLAGGSGRSIAWDFAWLKIQDNFYLGLGFSYTEQLYRENYEYLSALGHQGAAHNSYLTLWLDTGLIGLICFLGGLATLFLKASKYSALAIPILYAVLFSNYYESWITASLNPFTIQLLFILSFIFIYNDPIYDEVAAKDELTNAT